MENQAGTQPSHNPDQNAVAASPEAFVATSHPEPGIAVLTLNRPKARNALSRDMMAAVRNEIDRLTADPGTKAIVLAAAGPVFCAGHDLKELTARRADADGGKAFYEATMAQCADLMQAIVNCPKPIIAAVHAMATAAGCQLVASCDLAVAGVEAKFCTPGVNIGLFCSTPMVALSRNISRKRAMEMLLLGEVIGAADAADYGLVNRAVAQTEVMDTALSFARRIAEKSPATVAIGKQAFYAQAEMTLDRAYDFAADVMVRNMLFKDAQEGIGAFLEKRDPKWTGK